MLPFCEFGQAGSVQLLQEAEMLQAQREETLFLGPRVISGAGQPTALLSPTPPGPFATSRPGDQLVCHSPLP